jgi:hypothetical protein
MQHVPVVLEVKDVERQFSEFLTERASKCVTSQREWPHRLLIAFPVVCFSRANNSSTRRRLSTQ